MEVFITMTFKIKIIRMKTKSENNYLHRESGIKQPGNNWKKRAKQQQKSRSGVILESF